MSFGLRTWDEHGRIQTDTTTFTYQIVHQQVCDFSSTSSPRTITVSLPGVSQATHCAVLLPISAWSGDALNFIYAMPYVAVGSGSVTVSCRHPNAPDGYNDTRTVVRLMVMRFK